MATTLKLLAETLRAAREKKALSQRALGQRVGLPQSHISRIESGAVDLQTASLLQLARALDLEVALLPREALNVLRSIANPNPQSIEPAWARKSHRDMDILIKRSRAAARAMPEVTELEVLAQTLTSLRSRRFGALGSTQLHRLNRELRTALSTIQRPRETLGEETRYKSALHKLSELSKSYRQLLQVPALDTPKEPSPPEPAYRLRNERDER